MRGGYTLTFVIKRDIYGLCIISAAQKQESLVHNTPGSKFSPVTLSSIDMRRQLHLTAAVVAVFMTAWLAYSRGVTPSKDVTETSTFGVSDVWQYENRVPIEYGAVGPESLAFDPNGEGPYTGVSDGHIIKWHRHQNHWVDFAVTSSPHRLTLSTSFFVRLSICSTCIPLFMQNMLLVDKYCTS